MPVMAMNDPKFQLLLLALGVLGYALVLAVLRTLGSRVSLVLTRHDLLVESKRRRIAFHRELEARRNGESADSDVMIDDAETSDVIIGDEPPLRRAA